MASPLHSSHQPLSEPESLGPMDCDLFHMSLPGSLAEAVVHSKEMPLDGTRI